MGPPLLYWGLQRFPGLNACSDSFLLSATTPNCIRGYPAGTQYHLVLVLNGSLSHVPLNYSHKTRLKPFALPNFRFIMRVNPVGWSCFFFC